jgi:uncharacterized protein (TIGR02147 family)
MPFNLPFTIYVFDDYIKFLDEWFSYARRFGVTKKSFLAETGITSAAFLTDLLAGRRKLSVKHIPSFCSVLKLCGDEAAYFDALVKKGIAKKAEEIAAAAFTLSELRIKNLSSLLGKKNLEYFTSWKFPVVREYLVARKAIGSLKDVVDSLVIYKLTSREVESILKKLARWGMAEYVEASGVWRALETKAVFKYDELPHVVVSDAKRDMIDTAVKAMEILNKDDRHVTMAIRSMSRKKYDDFCQRIDELRREFLELPVEPGSEDRVVTLNIQAFPVMLFKEER